MRRGASPSAVRKRRNSALVGRVAALTALGVGLTGGSCGGEQGPPPADTGARFVTGAPAGPSSGPPTGARVRRIHRHVSPQGSDGNRGTRARPWRTLEHAAASVRPGVTVHVAPGHYAGPLTITRSGSARRPVRFVSERRWRARIGASSGGSLAVVKILGDHVTLAGFDVTGAAAAGATGIHVGGSDDTVAGNRVHDLAAPCAPGGGIVIAGDDYRQRDGLVTRNVVQRIGTGPLDGSCRLMHGIYAAVPRVTVVNNIVQQAIGDGITSWHAARNLIIANNLSAFNGGAGILVGSGDTGATSAGNIRTLVSNNIALRNQLYGITESSDGNHPVGPGNRYLNNLTFANREGGVGGLHSGEIVAGNVDADPRLKSPRYRPRADSPAVDAGTCAGAPRRDFGGMARQGRAVDIGPHELRSTPGHCER
jgi:Protein of unknown function (DUF1565)